MEGAHPHAYSQTSLRPPVLEGPVNSCPSGILPFPQDHQFRGEVHQVFPFIRPSDSMYQMTFPSFAPSTSESEGFQVAEDEEMILVDADATRDSWNRHMSTNTPSVAHLQAPVDTALDFSASSNFPVISHTPISVQSQQKCTSRDELRRCQTSRKGHAATISRPYRRRTGTRGVPKRPYSCDICGNTYAQPQGVTRHHREAHQVNVCDYCGDFRWGRRYQLRKHLEEQHPNIDPDTVLGGPGSRRKVTQISKYSPRQWVSTIEHGRRRCDEPRLCPQAPLPSDLAEVTLLSPPPSMSYLDYDPQPKLVEPMNTAQAQEDRRNLLFDATYIGATVSSTDEAFQQANVSKTDSQTEGIWYRNEGQSACQDGNAIANSQSELYQMSHPYHLLTDIVASQSSCFLWSDCLDPRILLHPPVQSMTDSASLSPIGRLPRRH